MEEVLRKQEVFQNDLASMVSSSVVGSELQWVGPQYVVVGKLDEKIGAQVGNCGVLAGESGGAVGMKALAEAMLVDPHLQEKSGLLKFTRCKRVFQTANNFSDVLDAFEMGCGENLDRMRSSTAEGEREKIGDSDPDGAKNFRSSDEGEGLSNGVSSSGLIESASQNLATKVKIMCSFGGKIIPRPSDGKLRYVGGETRIISLNKGISYAELIQKLRDMYGLALILKYQLPDEDLDSLVSVSSDEDLENMMEEYERLDGGEGSCRLRVFLFSAQDHDLSHFDAIGEKVNSQQCYVDAVNGFLGPGVGLRKQIESTSSEYIQPPQNAIVHNWWATLSAQEGTMATIPVQDTVNPINLPANAPVSSKPLSSNAPISSNRLSVNIPISSKQSLALRPSGASDVLMNVFPEQAARPIAQSYNALRPAESPVTLSQSDHGLFFGHSDPRVLALPSRTGHVFSVPTSNSKLFQDHNMLVTDARLRKVDSKGNFTQLQEEVGVAMPSLDHNLNVQPLHVDTRTIVFLPSSLRQSSWQDTHDLHQDGSIRMDCNQQDTEGHLQQFIPQSAPVSPRVNDHHLSINGRIDQEQLQKDDMLSDHYIPNFVSSQQTDHPVGSAATLCVVGSDPHFASLAHQHWMGNLQHTEVQQSSIAQILEQSQYGMNVNQYNDQGTGAFRPSVSTASLRELNSEQLSHQNVLSYEKQYGCQQGMPCGQASQSIHHQEMSSAHPDIFSDHRVTPLHSVREGIIHSELPDRVMPARTICERVTHSNEAIRSTSSCVAASAIEDQLMACTGQQNIGGERSGSNQQVNEAEPNLATLQNYVATHYTSEYVVQQQSVVPHFHQKPNVTDRLVSHSIEEQDNGSKHLIFSQKMPETEANAEWIPHLLGCSGPAEPESYTVMGFSEAVYTNSDSGLNSLNEAQINEIYKPYEGTNANPNILEQLGISEIPAEASKASEIATQLKELGMPPNVSAQGAENFNAAKGSRRLNDDNKLNFSYMQSNVLENTFAGEGETISSSSEVVDLPISINNLQMQNILSLDMPTSQPLQESRFLDTTVCISSSVMDNPLLSVDFVSLGYKEEETAPTHATTKDKLNDYVKAELQNEADVALKPPLLSDPTLSINTWAQFNDGLNNGNSIGRVTEVEVDDNLIIEEETKIEDSDNDDPINNAIIVEAEAIVRGLQTIKNADLEELQELGSGTFGTVYHGKWRGSDVAIKRIKSCCFAGRPSEQDSLKADFWTEACLLAQLHHPNIVAFYGVIPDGPGGTLGTVTEFMVNGSLKQNLQWNDRSIDHRKRIVLATDAAIGMEYLHSKNIVHFDLKCDNLLVNMKDPLRPICKVADFGLSKIKHQTLVSGGARGSLPWMAPELLNGSSNMVSDKVDVFSFGIVMWELLEGKEPYADLHYGAIIGGIVSNTLRPLVPNQCETSWKSLMERCWATDPAARPSFTEIVDELRSMLATLLRKGQDHQTSSQAPL